MYFPAIHDERTTLRNYQQVQLQAIRDAAHGLTDEQARRQPLASVFSVSGVIKHCSYVLRSRLAAAGVLTRSPATRTSLPVSPQTRMRISPRSSRTTTGSANST